MGKKSMAKGSNSKKPLDKGPIHVLEAIKDNKQVGNGVVVPRATNADASDFEKTGDNADCSKSIEKDFSQLTLVQLREEHLLRKHYLRLSFYLVGFVISVSLTIVVMCGAGILKLTPPVQIAMLTTMVANVIGILITAMVWLYQKKPGN